MANFLSHPHWEAADIQCTEKSAQLLDEIAYVNIRAEGLFPL